MKDFSRGKKKAKKTFFYELGVYWSRRGDRGHISHMNVKLFLFFFLFWARARVVWLQELRKNFNPVRFSFQVLTRARGKFRKNEQIEHAGFSLSFFVFESSLNFEKKISVFFFESNENYECYSVFVKIKSKPNFKSFFFF